MLGFLGSAFSALMGYQGQRQTNVANAKQAEAQMDFQAEMSRTAHQREVADLRAAGLNPILSGTGGAGATTPAGSQARMESELGAGISSAMQARMNQAQVANLRKQNDLIDSQNDNTQMDTAKKDKERTWTHIQGEKADIERKILEHQEKGWRIEGRIDSSALGAATRNINRVLAPITGGSSAYRNLFNQR